MENCLSCVKLFCYNKNVSAFYYADDGIKIAINKQNAQKLIDTESLHISKVNLSNNPAKSKVIKYSRRTQILESLKNETPLTMNHEPIPQFDIKSNQIQEFLGFMHNFDLRNFQIHHFRHKINTFKGILTTLYNKEILGHKLAIKTQKKYYKIKLRNAIIYGLKIIPFANKSMYKKLNSLQNNYLTTIFGAYKTTASDTLHILFGIPKLSLFLVKIKLSFYYDILKNTNNTIKEIILDNWIDFYYKYIFNNNKMTGIKQQYLHPIRDYILSLQYFGLPNHYIDINNLPNTRSEWINILNKQMKSHFQNQLQYFQENDGFLFHTIFKDCPDYIHSCKKPYRGFIKQLQILYTDNNLNTLKLKKSFKILFNNTKFNWYNPTYIQSLNDPILSFIEPKTISNKTIKSIINNICPLCNNIRHVSNIHLLFECNNFHNQHYNPNYPPSTTHQRFNESYSNSIYNNNTLLIDNIEHIQSITDPINPLPIVQTSAIV